MAPFEALYGRPCNSPSCWIETGEKFVLGPDVVRETSDKIKVIQQRMKAAQDRQKSYADKRRRDLKFSVGDLVFVKISPLKSVIRFGRRGKLTPRFVGPFPVLELVGNLAYRVDLPEKMAGVHNVFHVSQLRKFVHDSDVTISPNQLEDFEVEPEAVRNRKPIGIVGHDTKQLQRKAVKLVKVQWGEDENDCTWETEENIRKTHPELFAW